MDEEGPICKEKSWRFRRSTIARREFLEAVGTMLNSPPSPHRDTRQSRGRGRGRGRGKHVSEAGVISAATKRGRGGRRRAPHSVIAPSEEKSNEDEACGVTEGPQCVVAELKSGEKSLSGGTVSDRAEDSDDLSLQEIRKRAISRRLEELVHEDNVKDTECAARGIQQWEQDDLNMIHCTDFEGQTAAKREKIDCAEEDRTENSEEAREKIDGNVLCCICQQTMKNRFMICCDSCRKCHHTDCVGISEVNGRLLQENGEQFTCSTCSDDDNITRKIRNPNIISTFTAIVAKTLEEPKTVEQEMKMEEMLNEVKEEIIMLEEVKDALPKCIGPGCNHNALPESVYCGHRCIVQHAAMAMKCISEAKPETKPAPPPTKPLLKVHSYAFKFQIQKRSFLAKLFKVKVGESPPSEEKLNIQEMVKEESVDCAEVTVPEQQPSTATIEEKPSIREKEVEMSADTQSKLLNMNLDNPSSEKTPVARTIKKSTPGRARKTMPGSPRLEMLRGALSKTPGKSVVKSNKPPDVRPTPDDNAMAPLSSLLQIRQNIRCSLTEAFFLRINKVDHLETTEHDVEKLAVNTEKDVFNMYYTTDELYKDKCQQLVHNLKDPKNQDIACETDVHQMALEEISASHSLHVTENTVNVKSTNPLNATTNSDEKTCLSQRKQRLARKFSPDVPDMISCMLKDTTSQHKCHLFDLNCRICTGQRSSDGDPETKKLKIEMTKGSAEEMSLWVDHVKDEVPLPSTVQDSDITESPASPSAADCEIPTSSGDFSPVLIPSVPVLSLSRRDPRTAQFRQVLMLSIDTKSVLPQSQLHPPAEKVEETLKETTVVQPSPHVPVPIVPKSILMKPTPTSACRLDASFGSSTSRLVESHTPSDKGTRQFLSKQDAVWKGFLNMPTVAKFVTKGYLISGSPDFLKEDLPDTIQIGGRILPQTVWEYVDLIKTSEGKEMSLIRFHPGSEEEEVAYVSLFSYFNSRRRFGVVSNICKHIKDLYLIPLCAKQAIPSVLLPIEGPGLEQNHPNLLIGLVVCQKPKRPEAFLHEVGQKKPGLLIRSDSKEANNPNSLKTLEFEIGQQNTNTLSDPNVLIKTSLNSDPLYISSSQSCSSVLCQPKPITCVNPSRDSTGTTPLQTILDTLFGQRKQNPDATNCDINSTTAPDKVQQIQQTCTEANTMELCDDRPYDPEEYDPALTYGALESSSQTTVAEDDDRPYDPEEEYNAVDKGDFAKNNLPKISEATNTHRSSSANGDVAYDPEDETVFEEMQNYLAGNAITPQKFNICEQDNILNSTLPEQEKILEELNRQIEEQKRQLEEQTETLRLRKEAIGLSMAHFSVSHALMSPPPNFGRDEEEEMEKLPYLSTVDHIRDPRTCRETSRDPEDAPEAPKDENATQILSNMKENQTAVSSSCGNKEKLEKDKTLPIEGPADTKTVQLVTSTRSRSEHSSVTGSGRGSSKKRLHERRSDRHDRASSRASYKSRVPKDASDKHHRSGHCSKHSSSRSDSERRRLTSRTIHHDRHNHRDTSSSSRYKRRSDSSTRSHSNQRERSSKDCERSHKTDQQQPSVLNAQSSQPICEQPSIKQGSNAKADAERLHTSQNPGEETLNNNRNHFEISSKIDQSSKKGLLPMLYMQNVKTAHSYADQPFNSTTPTLQSPQTQGGVPHNDKKESPCQRSHNQPAHLSGSNHLSQKRGLPSMQWLNSFQNEADSLAVAGDYPQKGFQLQYRDFPQSNNSQSTCRDIPPQELPQIKSRDFLAREAECSSQLQTSLKQEGFTSGERGQFNKQMLPSHTDHQWSQEHRTPQFRGCSGEEPEINPFCHKKGQSYIKGQHFHRDESSQPQQRGSILGSPPVDINTFRPRPLNPSCFDKCKPSTEPLSVMERRKFVQPTNANTSTFAHSKTIRPGGPSPGSSTFQDDTDTHSGSHHIIKDVMGPVNSGGPSRGRFHNSPLSHCKSPKGDPPYRQFTIENNKGGRFHEGHSNNRGFLHHRPYKSRGCPPPHDAYEPQSPFSLQPFREDAEACLRKRSEPYPQDLTCKASPSMFEGQLCPKIKGQPRRPLQSRFRGQDVVKGFGRTRSDSPQQFMDQNAPSPDFHGERRPSSGNCDNFEAHDDSESSGFPNTTHSHFKRPEHQNVCESQNLRQPFESPSGQINIRPLRLSGPLLPTPVGCRIRPYIPRLQRPPNVSSRSRGPASMSHRPVTNEINGLWDHGEGHNLNSHQSDTSESLVQEERRGDYEAKNIFTSSAIYRFLSMACHSTNTPEKAVQAETEKWSKLDKMLLEASGQSELIFSEELTCSFRTVEVSDIVIRDLRVICTDNADQQISATLKNEAADIAGLPVKRFYTRICGSSNGTQHSENWKPVAGALNTKQGKKTRSCLDQTQRREIHNRKERDRRLFRVHSVRRLAFFSAVQHLKSNNDNMMPSSHK
ncbi:Death-inducer obliterator 1 [Triplophysa tibetana]|uniref:Death-inducer obliterator 1 n=1 Tax=Triplophysa tibetana TaxID=1572043 RepID=A0A5A9NCF2_9TELE|nr:Death-inducer obliterator 1 [Triplophysa tibetana]